MQVLDAIEKRRSVRRFLPDPIEDQLLLRLVDAARKAPSSHNLQPWEFILVTDPALRQPLSEAANNQAHVAQAPATFVILGSMPQQDALAARLEAAIPADATEEVRERRMRTVHRHRDDHALRERHVITNTYIGISFLVLAAESLGLSTIWMGGFDAEKVKALLQIPPEYQVVSLVSVGYADPDLVLKPRVRRSVEEITHWNRFGAKVGAPVV